MGSESDQTRCSAYWSRDFPKVEKSVKRVLLDGKVSPKELQRLFLWAVPVKWRL